MIIVPLVEEIAFRGVVLPGMLWRYRFMAANTFTAAFFLGIHLPGWYFQDRLRVMLTHPMGGMLSILVIGWALSLVAYKRKSVAARIWTHILHNLSSAS